MRISEIISEGRDAYLFHGTALDNALSILSDNAIDTGINWRGEGDRVATSRDWKVARDFGGYGDYNGPETIFVLDQTKLTHRFKLKPYRDYDSTGQSWSDEKEEMVMGRIYPLDRYLVSINISQKTLKLILGDTEYIDWVVEKWSEANPDLSSPTLVRKEIRKLASNPLLNRWSPRTG